MREYSFRNSGQTYNGIPIIAANMDTVGTFEMARALSKVNLVNVTMFSRANRFSLSM